MSMRRGIALSLFIFGVALVAALGLARGCGQEADEAPPAPEATIEETTATEATEAPETTRSEELPDTGGERR